MNEVLFAFFLIGIGIAAAQTPPDQARRIDMRSAEVQRILRQSTVRFIGYPTLRPLRPIRIIPTLKKMDK
jgi:hypothetical protein